MIAIVRVRVRVRPWVLVRVFVRVKVKVGVVVMVPGYFRSGTTPRLYFLGTVPATCSWAVLP